MHIGALVWEFYIPVSIIFFPNRLYNYNSGIRVMKQNDKRYPIVMVRPDNPLLDDDTPNVNCNQKSWLEHIFW